MLLLSSKEKKVVKQCLITGATSHPCSPPSIACRASTTSILRQATVSYQPASTLLFMTPPRPAESIPFHPGISILTRANSWCKYYRNVLLLFLVYLPIYFNVIVIHSDSFVSILFILHQYFWCCCRCSHEPIIAGFGSAFFFADPDPGKNLHADPDPEPGGIRGIKGKNYFL